MYVSVRQRQALDENRQHTITRKKPPLAKAHFIGVVAWDLCMKDRQRKGFNKKIRLLLGGCF